MDGEGFHFWVFVLMFWREDGWMISIVKVKSAQRYLEALNDYWALIL